MNPVSDDLLIKFLLKESTDVENLRVNQWLAEASEHRKRLEHLELVWDTAKKLENTRAIDEAAEWEKFTQRRTASEQVNPRPVKSISSRVYWLQLAAGLLIICSIGYQLFFKSNRVELVSATHGRSDTLPDGSVVTLNRNSQLSYREASNGEERQVTFTSGEAFFNVRPDSTKPFVIAAGKVNIQVVGTSFNVKHRQDTTDVIVATGKVRIRISGKEVILLPGQKVHLLPGQTTLRTEPNTDQFYRFYQSRVLVANNTPLWQVVEALNGAYDTEVLIANPRLRDLTITTTFDHDELENIIPVICRTLGCSSVTQAGKIYLR